VRFGSVRFLSYKPKIEPNLSVFNLHGSNTSKKLIFWGFRFFWIGWRFLFGSVWLWAPLIITILPVVFSIQMRTSTPAMLLGGGNTAILLIIYVGNRPRKNSIFHIPNSYTRATTLTFCNCYGTSNSRSPIRKALFIQASLQMVR